MENFTHVANFNLRSRTMTINTQEEGVVSDMVLPALADPAEVLQTMRYNIIGTGVVEGRLTYSHDDEQVFFLTECIADGQEVGTHVQLHFTRRNGTKGTRNGFIVAGPLMEPETAYGDVGLLLLDGRILTPIYRDEVMEVLTVGLPDHIVIAGLGYVCGFTHYGQTCQSKDKRAVTVLTRDMPIANAGVPLCRFHSPYC